jgi:ribonuclease HII
LSSDGCSLSLFDKFVAVLKFHRKEKQNVEDNPYLVILLPDEFNELLGSYENFVECCKKEMTQEQFELSARVLEKLQHADATHVCVDEVTDAQHQSKEFPITSITKADLVSAGFSEAVVAKLTDSDMQQIASAMEDVYCDHGYWEDLAICTNRTLERMEEDAVLEHNEHTAGAEDGLTGVE